MDVLTSEDKKEDKTKKRKDEVVVENIKFVLTYDKNLLENILKNNAEPLIYIGPTHVKSGLFNNMLFNNGLPTCIEQIYKDIADIIYMFVPCSDLIATQKAIREKGTLEYIKYNKVKEYFALKKDGGNNGV